MSVSGFEVGALDDGVFPWLIVQKLAFIYGTCLKLTTVRCFEYCIIKTFN